MYRIEFNFVRLKIEKEKFNCNKKSKIYENVEWRKFYVYLFIISKL